jgi:hypothetical protein
VLKALAIKELREIWWIAALALGLYLALVSNMIGWGLFRWFPAMPFGGYAVPFVGQGFASFFSLVAVGFALALGFRQSAWEDLKGSYLFLLHRPLRRPAVFLTKVATGIGLLLICSAAPILLYAWWAATPGHHPSPFEWSMTGQSWRICLVMPLVYLGAFVSGLRPARWIGTRLLPLAACGLVVVFAIFVPWWWTVGLPMALLVGAVLVVGICFVSQTRDYA